MRAEHTARMNERVGLSAALGLPDEHGRITWHKNTLLYTGFYKAVEVFFKHKVENERFYYGLFKDLIALGMFEAPAFRFVALGTDDSSTDPTMTGLECPLRSSNGDMAAGEIETKGDNQHTNVFGGGADFYEWTGRVRIPYSGDSTTVNEWCISTTPDPEKTGWTALNRGLISPGYTITGDIEALVRVQCRW